MISFDNYEELASFNNHLAEKLYHEYGEGEWMKEQLYYYPTLEDFAIYEVEEGVYCSLIGNFDIDFHGAPNLLDYINYQSLGEAISNCWDESLYWTDGEVVISSNHGFH